MRKGGSSPISIFEPRMGTDETRIGMSREGSEGMVKFHHGEHGGFAKALFGFFTKSWGAGNFGAVSDYPTCAKTYATFRVYHDSADPQAITTILGIAPTRSWRQGDSHGTKRVAIFPCSGWLLSSEHAVTSHDSLRHLEWLLVSIEQHRAELHALREQGHRMDISCYWLSESGHGGPMLTPEIMRRLGDLAIPVWFDVYFTGKNETDAATT